jgi:hypothetical protein
MDQPDAWDIREFVRHKILLDEYGEENIALCRAGAPGFWIVEIFVKAARVKIKSDIFFLSGSTVAVKST